MQIIVCVKQVIDTAARIELEDGRVNRMRLARVLNPYDEFAVEEALRIRERNPDTKVTLVSLGPENFSDALRAGLAMGADDAIHLLDSAFDEIDTLTAARLIAKAIMLLEFDLILCGKQAVDDDMAQIGPAIAIYLKVPCVTVVTQLDFASDWKTAMVTREVEGGSEIIESPLPVLFTCQKGLNLPRLPSFKGIMVAKKKLIKTFDAKRLSFVPTVMGDKTNAVVQAGLRLSPARSKGKIIKGSNNETVFKLVKALRETEKVV